MGVRVGLGGCPGGGGWLGGLVVVGRLGGGWVGWVGVGW